MALPLVRADVTVSQESQAKIARQAGMRVSMANIDLKSRIEDRINRGLLGQWYPVAKTVQVKSGRPFGVTALGRRLVLWRGADGRVNCLEDFCPHRGAPLSRGEVNDGNLACRYHGVTLDGTGRILRVPAMPECALEGRQAAAAFATTEGSDAIFVYFPKANEAAPALQWAEELTSSEWAHFLCTSRWDCNYRYALDNLADPMHGCYLHADSFTLAYGAKQDTMKVEPTKTGFIVSRVQQQGENFDWAEMILTDSTMYCRLDIPYPKVAGPGGPMRIVGFVTPIDEGSCCVYFWRCRKVTGLARQAWAFLYRSTLEKRHWAVLEQDREMLVAMPGDARKREMLYQHDIGVARVRQHLARASRSQIEAEDAAGAKAAS
jgi:phenylpropionate dioxygenase-like ring-hydroxylating dioxygenase large terminal subunit